MDIINKYHVQFEESYEKYMDAYNACKKLQDKIGMGIPMRVGYYLEQPTYRKWVPIWLIRLLTKKGYYKY